MSPVSKQALAVLVAPLLSFVAMSVLLRIVGLAMPLRGVSRAEGVVLDVIEHGEGAYTSGDGAILLRTEPAAAGRARVGEPDPR